MGFFTVPAGVSTLPDDVLEKDKKECRRFGPCGVGEEALYLNGRFFDRRYYAPWKDVKRVYKRVAVTKGAETGKGLFASMPFLVVMFSDGSEKEYPFKNEADVDNLLNAVAQGHPKIPTYSKEAMARLREAEAEEKKRFSAKISDTAKGSVKKLETDKKILEARPALSDALVSAARQKRVADRFPTSYLVIGSILAGGGVIAMIYGLIGLIMGITHPFYFIFGGLAAFFTALASNTVPSKWNSRKYAQQGWDSALAAMKDYLKDTDFSLPAQYAHPTVIMRTVRVLHEGRAETVEEAFAVMKDDLKALNSSVRVSQKEHDEVVAVKPLFLVCDYSDEA